MATPDNGTQPPPGLSSKALHAEALKRITPAEWQSVAGDAGAIEALIARHAKQIRAERIANPSQPKARESATTHPAADPADPAMDETAADMESPEDSAADASDEPGEDIDLNRIYDRPEVAAAADAASLYRYDPEAGKTSVAVKVRAVTAAVRNSVATPFGKLVVVLPLLLLGVSLTIAAVTIQDAPFIIAAVVVMPASLGLVYWRYQVWLGHKRYLYRLLETLGEDVSDFDPHKIYRKAGMRAVKKRR